MKKGRVDSAAYKAEQAAKTAETKAAAEVVFQKHAQAVFLDYHEKAGWAVRKVEAGLRLAPEAVEYMEREIASRKLAEEARQKNLETENVKNPESEPAADSKPAGDGERNVGGPVGVVQEKS